MDALNNILNRISARELSLPHPTKDEMDEDELKKIDEELD